MTISLRFYRLLLRFYPRSFRDEFGEDMCATFHRVLRDRRSIGARLHLWYATIIDSVAGGVRERIETARRRRDRPPVAQVRSASPLETLAQDLRFAARSLKRRPAFVAAVMFTLALGIGANTAIFSLIDAVLLRPVPVSRPDQVVSAFHRLNERTPHEAFPFPLYTWLARQSRSLAGVAGYHVMDIGVRIGNRVVQMETAGVSGNYFDVLGLLPQAGRLLHATDDGPVGANPIVVLSDEAWVQHFNRDGDAIGSTIHAGGRAYTIVGVAPRRFRGTDLTAAPQLWFPIAMSTSLGEGGLFSPRPGDSVFETTAFGWVEIVGRLRPGTSQIAAAGELNALTSRYWASLGSAAAGRDTMTAPVSVMSLASSAAMGDRENLVRFVVMLSIVVGLTLLIACVNVANLLIIRGAERARELAVRAALGASRARLSRQTLLESLLLAALGGVAAAGVGMVAMRFLAAYALPGGIALDRLDLGLNARVLTFTAATAVLAAVLFGFVPALRAGRSGTAPALRTHGANAERGTRGALLLIQAGMAVLLLVGAGLFARSLQAGLSTDLGFDPRGMAAATVDLSLHGYDKSREKTFLDEALERARRIPGVSAAAFGTQVPLSRLTRLPFTPVEGSQVDGSPRRVSAGLVRVSDDYFDVLGVPLMAGRPFTSTSATGMRVAIVNESAARLLAPSGSILDREITLLGSIRFTIIGIVRDTKYTSVRDSGMAVVFEPVSQPGTTVGLSLIVRSNAPQASLAALPRMLQEIDPDLPVRDVRLVANQINTVLMPQRFGTTLLGALALVALGIASVGIYGVVAYGVSRRARELGIRIALGARRLDIVRTVASRIALAVATGLLLGAVTAAMASRGLERFLYGVSRLDLPAFAGAALLLAAAAALACWSPVRRALRVDPATSIRYE